MTPVIPSITRTIARTIAPASTQPSKPSAVRRLLSTWRRALFCLPLMMMAVSAQASAASGNHPTSAPTKLWRCASTSGQISYSQQPCDASGTQESQAMQVKDERTRTQQRQSMDNQLRDAKLARAMRGERLHQERVASLDKPISMSGKGKPHVIKSTPNDHRPVPISDSTRPIKVKAPKAEKGGKAQSGSKMEAPIGAAP